MVSAGGELEDASSWVSPTWRRVSRQIWRRTPVISLEEEKVGHQPENLSAGCSYCRNSKLTQISSKVLFRTSEQIQGILNFDQYIGIIINNFIYVYHSKSTLKLAHLVSNVIWIIQHIVMFSCSWVEISVIYSILKQNRNRISYGIARIVQLADMIDQKIRSINPTRTCNWCRITGLGVWFDEYLAEINKQSKSICSIGI